MNCNIYKRQCIIKFPKACELCHNCKGAGCLFISAHFKQRHARVFKCPICNGSGYVDWITRARGEITTKNFMNNHTLKMKTIKFRCNHNGCKVIKRWSRNKI